MKIGIDISQIVYGTGVSVYTKNLVKSLLKINNEDEFLLFGGSLRQREALKDFISSLSSFNNVTGRVFFIPPKLADILWNKLHILPIDSLLGKVDVFHSSDWTQPPSNSAKVTTIHDFGFIKYPSTAHPKIASTMKGRFEWVKKDVDLIIAISKATKNDIVDILGISPKKVKVVYEALPKDIKKVQNNKLIADVKKKYKIKNDFLLSVATLEPRKNLKRVILAFNEVKKIIPDMQLVLAGKLGWDQDIKKMMGKRPKDIIFTGFIDREHELSSLYSSASCFVFPSLYEGFGLPILEAMVCGCPVVTSNISSMPEVAGDAAVLVEPLEVESISHGIVKAIKEKDALVKKGFEQIDKFSWEKTAKETLRVYKQAVKNK